MPTNADKLEIYIFVKSIYNCISCMYLNSVMNKKNVVAYKRLLADKQMISYDL